jgi:hypothetical protein
MTNYVPLFETYSTPSWWVGIADCNGIESFIKEPDMSDADDADRLAELGLDEPGAGNKMRKGWSNTVSTLQMRARANSQRHAVVYRVKLNTEDSDQIEELLADGEYTSALDMLKQVALETQIARGTGINAEKAWNMIPNPDLDPFS